MWAIRATNVINHLLFYHVDMEKVLRENPNYKSLLLEWGQKNSKEIKFEIIEEKGNSFKKEFTAQVVINGEPQSTGTGQNKKRAEQIAALQACKELNLA